MEKAVHTAADWEQSVKKVVHTMADGEESRPEAQGYNF